MKGEATGSQRQMSKTRRQHSGIHNPNQKSIITEKKSKDTKMVTLVGTKGLQDPLRRSTHTHTHIRPPRTVLCVLCVWWGESCDLPPEKKKGTRHVHKKAREWRAGAGTAKTCPDRPQTVAQQHTVSGGTGCPDRGRGWLCVKSARGVIMEETTTHACMKPQSTDNRRNEE